MIGPAKPLVLGSSSPRRAEILTTLGLPFRVIAPTVDETLREGELAEAYIERVVDEKARAVVALLGDAVRACTLVADTVVTQDGRVFGKPRDEVEAEAMLTALSGRPHTVMTRYRIDTEDARMRARNVASVVHFRRAQPDEIRRYAASGEGLDKAGAYALQGLGAFLVERLEGSYSAVVGLPACELILDLQDLGLLEGFPWSE